MIREISKVLETIASEYIDHASVSFVDGLTMESDY